MTTTAGAPVVDSDGHVLEPADTWEKYLEPAYRDRAIRIDRDEHGYEVLLIDGRPLKTLRGQLRALGGIDMDAARLLTRGQVSDAEGSPPGGYDPIERLRVMDREGIDAVLLYPTIGICWEGHVTDGALATAYTRAYNRWLRRRLRQQPLPQDDRPRPRPGRPRLRGARARPLVVHALPDGRSLLMGPDARMTREAIARARRHPVSSSRSGPSPATPGTGRRSAACTCAAPPPTPAAA